VTRPLGDQVVVITGASSGIGRETALQLAARGASVVLAARNQEALEEVARQVERIGGRAEAVPTDVASWPQVQALAERAVERFGRIDTLANVAAVSLYATVEQATPEEIEQVIRVDLLGQIHGVKAVLSHMRRQGSGTIINVGSALSERAVPLQAAYSAAKHGLKGFTEALRLELDREQSGISVVLIEPSSVNTPLFDHARSKVGRKPMPIPPIYEPSVVAEAIVSAAERPTRKIVVGGSGKLLVLAERVDPRLLDLYMLFGDRMVKSQLTEEPPSERDNLFAPVEGRGSTTGRFGDRSKSTSVYTRLFELRPVPMKAVLLALLAGSLALWRVARS
jgi:NAD(P)-dependent dehydrogenase (short-subunit alcohol dehydrogenase family)